MKTLDQRRRGRQVKAARRGLRLLAIGLLCASVKAERD
jgi:hypothetical protein